MSDELVEKIKASFYIKDRVYRTNVFDIIGENDDNYFYQAISEMLTDGEVLFAYQSAAIDNDSGFIFYKSRGKIIKEYIYSYDNGLECDLSGVCWRDPKDMNLTSIELREFAIKLRNYINFNELPIFIFPVSIYEDIKESTDHQQCSELTERRIILLAIFWRLGYFILLIPVFLVSEYLLETGMLLLLLSIVLLIYGGYFILGNTKGFRHIYCAYQDWEGKEMTPSLINWKSIGRIKSIIPGFFSVIGLACLIGYLITII